MTKILDIPYMNILVLGLAKSGTSAAKLLIENGKKIRINDFSSNEDDPVIKELQDLGAEVILGSHPLSVLDNIELVVKNPGIPYDNPIVDEAINQKIPVITEVELAGRINDGKLIGITGSNGKTTTTTLISEMFAKSNLPVQMAGNIGIVATEVARKVTKDDILVMELSSFQLQGIDTFTPNIAVLLNIVEAHLDYHKTLQNYKEAKFNIFKNQTEADYVVYNADDQHISEAIQKAHSQKVPFSTKKKVSEGAWLDEDSIYFRNEKVVYRKDIVLVGDHNLENILASVCAAKLGGASNRGIQKVLNTFSGVKHRLQYVETINGRVFYNDSKATNVLATQKALAAFNQPTILLAGGLDRGNSYDEMIPYLSSVKAIVAFGETADKIKQTALKAGVSIVELAEDVEQATKIAYSLSEVDDVILLSPASASWDQYRSFEERGDMFIQAVHTIK
ncbi:UDP-N-acetylmuramoyl-L-alanine--D-glutamate ligase [Ornithinibacillus halophilus]|uniref:UDP-N-acetylmuramoylalanine--D-glutamate ligase n=1 Tax=Ornithinibacillus halophilus TaxID=930117 RepID=A0A1M5C497_9BACI|nr:UDP-N-acetylmuramoyl-L-alanine--D-glutamate ligase [Ornithinibacillus halophilus]SHF49510.1 UDP-N-acetylmuramoylalanine--D-glutamate ligase [Ornithinibacillus halophilus]